MRYLIETLQNEGNIGSQIAAMQTRGDIEIIEKGDPVEEIKSQLIKIGKAFEYLKSAGIDEEVMIAYIQTKGVPKGKITEVLFFQKEFLKKLGVLK